MTSPRISICIVNWEATDLLRACLESIRALPPTGGHEIIVVDNNSGDFDASSMATEFPQVRWIVNDTNLGYAIANNQAVAQSTGRYILLLNPDTQVTDGAFDRLAAFLDEHLDAAAASPKLVWPDGRTQRSCRGFPDPWSLFFDAIGLARLAPKRLGRYRMRDFDHESTRMVAQPMFSAIIIRRDAWDQIGTLDERFPIFWNDVDWCMRAREAGRPIYFVADAAVIHHHGQSTKHMGSALTRESHRSLVELYNKHYRNRMSRLSFEIVVALIRIAGSLRGF